MLYFYRLKLHHLTGVTNDLRVGAKGYLKADECSTWSRRTQQPANSKFHMTNIILLKVCIKRLREQKRNPLTGRRLKKDLKLQTLRMLNSYVMNTESFKGTVNITIMIVRFSRFI